MCIGFMKILCHFIQGMTVLLLEQKELISPPTPTPISGAKTKC